MIVRFLISIFSCHIAKAQHIITDPSIVDDYDFIPQDYIDKVKKMWAVLAGESHSTGYRIGLMLFEGQNN